MIRIVTVPWVLTAAFATCLFAPRAFADDKQVCTDAYGQAQTLRDAHKLTEAREQLRVCARAECPGFIAKDCAAWLKDVEPRIPSVVLIAKNAAGSDLVDVKVTVDGAPLATKLDGLAVDVDPGAHTFAFEAPDGKVEQKVVIAEGGKAQRVSVAFGAAGTAPVVTTTPGTGVAASAPVAAAAKPGAAPTPEAGSAPSKFDFFPKEPVDSGVSVSFRLGWGFPFGKINGNAPGGNGDTSLGGAATGQVAFWFDAGYLVNPYVYLGAHFSYGIVPVPSSAINGLCGDAGVSCSGGDVRVGADFQWRILGTSALQPWIGLGVLGYERINFSLTSLAGSVLGQGSAAQAFNGIEWVTPQVGFDYKIFPALSAGIFAGMTLSQYLGTSLSEGGVPMATSMYGNPLHGWVFLGGRVNYDLHL
jgi:hypothetical protein